MNVLSLFDGMACGMLAMQRSGIHVDRYVAYEIDKYAVKTSSHNFPMIEHRGDVFEADFTEFRGFDYLIGGSPCTYWSIAQSSDKRETTASGLSWELFSQYVRALREAQPKYFLYENNKSMSAAIRASITETFGFEPICINSALVSAQNRQRLYWVGKRNEDGSYSKVDVEQPEDRGILLRDILETGDSWREKSLCLDANYYKATSGTTYSERQSGQGMCVAEPVYAGRVVGRRINEDGHRDDYNESVPCFQRFEANENPQKTNCLTTVSKDNMIAEPVKCASVGLNVNPSGHGMNGDVIGIDWKSRNLTTNKGEGQKIIVPVCMRYERSDEAKACRKDYEAGRIHHGYHELSELHPRDDEKSNTLSTVLKDNPICEPVRIGTYPNDSKRPELDSQQYRIYSPDGKSVNLCGNGGGMGAKTGLYAIPVDWNGAEPIKAISCVDGKEYPVYRVQDGQITIKGKTYPIKLIDGFYIIRKLTVRECMRLQTVPEDYDFSVVSNSQAYKMLGNGWTVSVISHLLDATKEVKMDSYDNTVRVMHCQRDEWMQERIAALSKERDELKQENQILRCKLERLQDRPNCSICERGGR